jgi:hypothetical protein
MRKVNDRPSVLPIRSGQRSVGVTVTGLIPSGPLDVEVDDSTGGDVKGYGDATATGRFSEQFELFGAGFRATVGETFAVVVADESTGAFSRKYLSIVR